jgi:endonuclease V-like protein UPF0215 family
LIHRSLRVVKPEIRVLGVDDGKFVSHSKGKVLVVGVVFRAGCWMEGVMSTQVEVDGFDATANLACMIKGSPHFRQLRVVMLNGITLGGFNVVDINLLNAETGLPVIAVAGKKPDLESVHSAIQKMPKSEERWKAILRAGEIFPAVTRGETQRVHVETAGISKEAAVAVLRLTATRSKIPEPLRVAHLIASGVSLFY